MARLETFVGTWKIKSWTPANDDPKQPELPADGFGPMSDLVVIESGAEACGLSWLNGHGLPCSMQLPFSAGGLQGEHLVVDFAGGEIRCATVTVLQTVADDGSLELTGTLIRESVDPKVTGNGGTFIAEAPPITPGDGEPTS
jgi:hypothetical protein